MKILKTKFEEFKTIIYELINDNNEKVSCAGIYYDISARGCLNGGEALIKCLPIKINNKNEIIYIAVVRTDKEKNRNKGYSKALIREIINDFNGKIITVHPSPCDERFTKRLRNYYEKIGFKPFIYSSCKKYTNFIFEFLDKR